MACINQTNISINQWRPPPVRGERERERSSPPIVKCHMATMWPPFNWPPLLNSINTLDKKLTEVESGSSQLLFGQQKHPQLLLLHYEEDKIKWRSFVATQLSFRYIFATYYWAIYSLIHTHSLTLATFQHCRHSNPP